MSLALQPTIPLHDVVHSSEGGLLLFLVQLYIIIVETVQTQKRDACSTIAVGKILHPNQPVHRPHDSCRGCVVTENPTHNLPLAIA